MNRHKQKGAVLMVSLVILVLLTLLGVSAMGTSNLQVQIASNTAQRTQSTQDADSGLSEALSAFRGAPGALTGVGLTADYAVDVWDAGNPFYDVFLSGAAAHNGPARHYQYLNFVDIPVIVDGTISCYDGCDIDLTGNVHVDGRDHLPPSNFNCNGAACAATLDTSTPEPSIPAIYQSTGGSVVQSGSTTLNGSTPIIQTGGGVYTQDLYAEFVSILMQSASAHNGSAWGDRTAPIIHVISQDGYMINSNIDGAGILIITADEVTVNGNFHFEGLVIFRRAGGVVMHFGGGTDICGAVVATSPGSVMDLGGAGTPRITYCSDALSGAAGVDAVSVGGWFDGT